MASGKVKDRKWSRDDYTEDAIIAVVEIDTSPANSARVKRDSKAIEDYVTNLDQLPAVLVGRDPEGNIWLEDGAHRLEAHKRADRAEIACRVRETTGFPDSFWAACEANKTHQAIRVTNEDKRRRVDVALADPVMSRWSARELAEMCGVDHSTVSERKKALKQGASDPDSSDTVIGKDGKERPATGTYRPPLKSRRGRDPITKAFQDAQERAQNEPGAIGDDSPGDSSSAVADASETIPGGLTGGDPIERACHGLSVWSRAVPENDRTSFFRLMADRCRELAGDEVPVESESGSSADPLFPSAAARLIRLAISDGLARLPEKHHEDYLIYARNYAQDRFERLPGPGQSPEGEESAPGVLERWLSKGG